VEASTVRVADGLDNPNGEARAYDSGRRTFSLQTKHHEGPCSVAEVGLLSARAACSKTTEDPRGSPLDLALEDRRQRVEATGA